LLRQRSEVAMLRAELESLAGGEGGLAGAVTAATGDAAAGPSGTLRYGGGGVPEPEGGLVGPVTGGVELPEPQGYYFKKLASAT